MLVFNTWDCSSPLRENESWRCGGICTLIAEEIVYRGLAQQYFSKYANVVVAIGLQAVAFAIQHSGASYILMLVIGIGLGILAHRRGLFSALVAHGAYNMAILVTAFLEKF